MKNIFIIFLLISTLFSCERTFEEAKLPATTITENFSSNEDLERLTVGSYFFWQGYHEGIFDLGMIIPTFASDEGKLVTGVSANVEIGNHDNLFNRDTENNTIPYLERIWQSGYEVVHLTNTVLNILNTQGAFPDENSKWENRLKGENYFCRAVAYYTLIKTFAGPYDATADMSAPGIIVRDKTAEGPFDTGGLSSIQDAYDKVIDDLKLAIEFLPETYDPERDPASYQDRAQKDVAKFLLARVYFQMGSEFWENALPLINELLDENKYPLNADPQDTYSQTGLGIKTTETVFQYASYNPTTRWRYPVVLDLFDVSQANTRVFNMNTSFQQFIGWDDVVERENDKRFNTLFQTQLFEGSENIWVSKYSDFDRSIPMMRAPELHLTRAIIALLTGTSGGNETARKDLAAIITRAYVDPKPILSELQNATTEELINMTHRERAIELFFEGDRLYYLQAIRGKVGSGDRFGAADQQPLDWNSDKLHWGIPQREINLNNNL